MDDSSGLTAAQAAARGIIVRPLENNANCFPNQNENVSLGFHNGTCCWNGGLGNAPNGQATWRTHDLALLQASRMSPPTCSSGSYPCNDNGYALSNTSFCYGTSCKETWAEIYVR